MKESIKEIMTIHYLTNPILKAVFATLEDFLNSKTTKEYNDWISHAEKLNKEIAE